MATAARSSARSSQLKAYSSQQCVLQVVDPEQGTSSVRLFHDDQLAPLLDSPLAPGHEVLALSLLTLPTLTKAPPAPYTPPHNPAHHPHSASQPNSEPSAMCTDTTAASPRLATPAASDTTARSAPAAGPGGTASTEPGTGLPGPSTGAAADGDGRGGAQHVLVGREYLCMASALAARGDCDAIRTLPLLSIFRVDTHRVPDACATRWAPLVCKLWGTVSGGARLQLCHAWVVLPVSTAPRRVVSVGVTNRC